MEKTAIKAKKEIRVKLSDSLHEAIKTLGIAKSGKKVEKILEKTSRKLANKVADRIRKESKKLRKGATKMKKAKKTEHAVAA